jgi:hypothetical protein
MCWRKHTAHMPGCQIEAHYPVPAAPGFCFVQPGGGFRLIVSQPVASPNSDEGGNPFPHTNYHAQPLTQPNA